MLAEVANYLALFQTQHDQLGKCVEGLGQDALDWIPTPEANSLTVLVAHAVGAERFLIGQTVGGVNVHRNRDLEFRVTGLDAEALRTLITTAAKETETTLAPLTEAEIALSRPFRDGTATTRWCIGHALEHLAEHVGHAGLTRQLWLAGHRPPAEIS
jgi:hypothetical protein